METQIQYLMICIHPSLISTSQILVVFFILLVLPVVQGFLALTQKKIGNITGR